MRIRGMSVPEIFCRFFMWVVRPFTAPMETMLHRRVGERFPGVASVAFLALLGLLSFGPNAPTMPRLLLIALGGRMAAVRVLSVRARRRGDPIPSRSSGEPWLSVAFPCLPQHVARLVEPFALFAMAMAVGQFDEATGGYLVFAAAALLATATFRFMLSYSSYLDAVDAAIVARNETARSLDGRADRNQLNLPWTGGFPVVPALALATAAEPVPVA
jgi:hypothetical protein